MQWHPGEHKFGAAAKMNTHASTKTCNEFAFVQLMCADLKEFCSKKDTCLPPTMCAVLRVGCAVKLNAQTGRKVLKVLCFEAGVP